MFGPDPVGVPVGVPVAVPFDPTGLRTCLAGDDDYNGTLGSQMVTVSIAPGQTLFLVASTWAANATIGPYTITVATN